jgi:hypothetical protein
LANYDYYQLMVKGEKLWAWVPSIFATAIGAITFPIVTFGFVIVAAGVPIPIPMATALTCSSVEAIRLVDSIAKSESKKYLTVDQLADISFGLSNIKMTDSNEARTAYMCSANLETVAVNGSHSTPITYKIELMAAGEYQVNVYGL